MPQLSRWRVLLSVFTSRAVARIVDRPRRQTASRRRLDDAKLAASGSGYLTIQAPTSDGFSRAGAFKISAHRNSRYSWPMSKTKASPPEGASSEEDETSTGSAQRSS